MYLYFGLVEVHFYLILRGKMVYLHQKTIKGLLEPKVIVEGHACTLSLFLISIMMFGVLPVVSYHQS